MPGLRPTVAELSNTEMHIVEILLQGVKGSPTLSRWVLPPVGVAIIPAGEAEALVARAIFELLAGIQDGVVAGAVLPDEAGAQGRCAVVILGRDQQRYRVLWDLKSGRKALQVQKGENFEVLATTRAEILQALTATVGLPQPDALREIFFSFAEDLPSKRTSDEGASSSSSSSSSGKPPPPGFEAAPSHRRDSGKVLPPGFAGSDGEVPGSKWLGMSESQLRARLKEIDDSTTRQQRVAQLEFELDGLQYQMFAIEAQLKPLVILDNDILALKQQLTRFAHLENLPADFLERARFLQGLKVETDKSLKKVAAEREKFLASAAHLSNKVSGVGRADGKTEKSRPLREALEDPLVTFGGAIGAGAILIGALGSIAYDGLRWLALLNIPAFGSAVFGGIRVLTRLEEGVAVRMKLARIDDEKARIDERFSIDKEHIERVLKDNQLTFDQLPEIEEESKARAEVAALLQKAEEQRSAAETNGDALTLKAQLEDSLARRRDMEEQLQSAGQYYDVGTAQLVKEKDDITKILNGVLKASVATSDRKIDLDELMGHTSSSRPRPAVTFDCGQRIVHVSADLLLATIEDTAANLSARATQILQALTDRRFSAFTFGSKAEVSVIEASSAQSIAFVHLPPGDRDLAALALRLTAIEAAAKKQRMPLIFDRIFDHLSAEKMPTIVRVLQFLGEENQVTCMTVRRELAAAGAVVTAIS